MYVSAEVEDEDVVREAFRYLYDNLPLESFIKIINEIFETGHHYLRDWMGLVIDSTGDKALIPSIKHAIDNEKMPMLKRHLEHVLADLENK